jgi:hypothetical protein
MWSNYSIQQKLELMKKSEHVIWNINYQFNRQLTIEGENDIISKVIDYGDDEVLNCFFISLDNYSHLGEEVVLNKLGGILYNRNNRNLLSD